jgi:hypothetical protein
MARPRWRFLHSAGAHHDQDVRVTLNTYESRAIADVFVTLRAVEAEATLATVDVLGALRLERYRAGYETVPPPPHEVFFRMVTSEITARGFALHGFDLAFERRRRRRSGLSPAAS